MKKLTMLLVGFLLLTLFANPVPIVSADDNKQSDHMLLDGNAIPAPEHGYCGVGKKVEPWQLHVSYSPGGGGGTLTIQFRDGSSIAFPVPSGSSFSLTQAMGGVPGVDDLVRIDITAGGAWVSALARSGARDPFDEPPPAEKDNFCLNVPAERGTGTVGVTLPPPFPTSPNAWLDGNNKLQ